MRPIYSLKSLSFKLQLMVNSAAVIGTDTLVYISGIYIEMIKIFILILNV